MKLTTLTFLLSFFTFFSNGQSSYQYAVSYGDSTMLFGFDNGRLELTPDNGIIIMESRKQQNVKAEFLILKFDTAFNPIYTLRMRRPIASGSQDDLAADVLPLPDGGFMFASHVDGASGTSPDDIALFRFDNQGTEIFHRQYANSSGLLPFNLKYFAQDSILLGFRSGGRFGYMMAEENGDPHHIRMGQFPGIVSYGNSGMIRTANNNILNFAEGNWNTSPTDKPQLALAMYDKDGTLQWAYRYADTTYHYFIHDGIELANGNFLFCGGRRFNLTSGGHGFLMCISATGQFLWSKFYNPLPLTLKKLTQLSPDTILVSGQRNSPYFGVNYLVDTTGTLLYWSGFDSGIISADNYHLTVSNNDKHFFSATGLISWGDESIILSKSYPSNYDHCTHNPVLPNATPITQFITYSDFTPSTFALLDTPVTRTYTYDYTLPAVTLQCISTGSNENDKDNLIVISPNPGHGTFTIKTTPGMNDLQFEILNPKGQLIFNGTCSGYETAFNLEGFASGIYFFRGFHKNGFIHQKFVLAE